MIIKIKYHADITPIEQVPGSAWIDLRAAENIAIKMGEAKKVSLGVSMELPEGCEAIMAARSSLFDNHGCMVTNGIGIIDNNFCGDEDVWKVQLYATRNTVINKDERICQFRVLESMGKVEFIEVNTHNKENRGGFGSTGVN